MLDLLAFFAEFLVDNNLVTVAFAIGAGTLIIAVIGRLGINLELSPRVRVVLMLIGAGFLIWSFLGYYYSREASAEVAKVPTPTESIVTSPNTPSGAVVLSPSPSVTLLPTVTSLPPTEVSPSAMLLLPTDTVSPSVAQPTPCPTREHKSISVGTGAFANAIYSDGLAECPEGVLKANHPNTQWVHPSVSADGCGVSIYNTDKLWLAAFPGTVVTVNGNVIGQWTAPAYQHGYVIEYQIQVGDKICVNPPSSYTMLWGPDIFYEYDSYCFRGHCD